jgi:iron complex transport system ATP-binding protein
VLQAIDLSFSYRRQTVSEPDGLDHVTSPRTHRAKTPPARHLLEGVSLTVDAGDLVGILGPNGSGKTTLLNILAGGLIPQRGSVHLDGRPLHAWSRREIARRLAMVPQHTHAPFDFAVLDIVLMGRFPHLGPFALEGPADLAIAMHALEVTGMEAFATRAFNTLSGGEQQRVAIASALAQSPRLLFLDEPTTSLDIGHQMDVQALLERLNVQTGVTMVLTTHDLNLAALLCRRLVLLKDGRVLAAGPTEDVLTPQAVRELYGVDALVERHARSGYLTVVPIGRA